MVTNRLSKERHENSKKNGPLRGYEVAANAAGQGRNEQKKGINKRLKI